MAAAVRLLARDALTAQLRGNRGSDGCILGLDISTRAIGIARVQLTGMLMSSDVITAGASESTFKLAGAVCQYIQGLQTDSRVCRTLVEEPLKSFTPGRFHTQGLFKLAGLNRIIGYDCWRTSGAPVDYFNATTMRAALNITAVPDDEWARCRVALHAEFQLDADSADVFAPSAEDTLLRQSKGSEAKVKLAVLRYVTALYPHLAATWQRTRTGTLKPTCFDRADALLIAAFGVVHHQATAVLSDPGFFAAVYDALCTNATSLTPAKKGGRKKATAATALTVSDVAAARDSVMLLHTDMVTSAVEECAHVPTTAAEVGGDDEQVQQDDNAADEEDAVKPRTRTPKRKLHPAAEALFEDCRSTAMAALYEELVPWSPKRSPDRPLLFAWLSDRDVPHAS